MVKPDGEGDNAWATSIVPSAGYQYDKNHNFWKDSLPAGLDSYILEAPYMFPSDEDTMGMAVNTSCSGWGTSYFSGDITWTTNTTTYINNFNLIMQLSQELADKGIHLILINFPMSPNYKNTAYYSSDGPSWATATAVVAQFRALESSNSYFHFYDAYNNGVNDYSDADAFNCNHLCPNGAAKLTARLNTYIHTLIGQ
jgi:hypothetical protein